MLLADFLQTLKNVVNLFFSLVEAHGLSGVLHSEVDIVLIEFVELRVVSLKKIKCYLLLLFLLLLHFIIDKMN